MSEDDSDEEIKQENEEDENITESKKVNERPLMFGALAEGLQSNLWTMTSFLEEKKNKTSQGKKKKRIGWILI